MMNQPSKSRISLLKPEQVSGGSSSGPAASVSAGFAPLGIGTETTGSTVLPASTNGIYALKLSYGTVPTHGIFKLSRSFDCVGVMARDPVDLAPLASVLLSGSGDDGPQAGNMQADSKGVSLHHGVRDGIEKGFEGMGIGVMAPAWGVHESIRKGKWDHPDVVSDALLLTAIKLTTTRQIGKYEGAVEKMKSLGAKTVYPLQVPEADDVLKYRDQSLVTAACKYQHMGTRARHITDRPKDHEFPHNVDEFIACFHGDDEIRNLQDIVGWNERNSDIAMPERKSLAHLHIRGLSNPAQHTRARPSSSQRSIRLSHPTSTPPPSPTCVAWLSKRPWGRRCKTQMWTLCYLPRTRSLLPLLRAQGGRRQRCRWGGGRRGTASRMACLRWPEAEERTCCYGSWWPGRAASVALSGLTWMAGSETGALHARC